MFKNHNSHISVQQGQGLYQCAATNIGTDLFEQSKNLRAMSKMLREQATNLRKDAQTIRRIVRDVY